MASSSSASLYDVLGISVGASCNEIKAAYRKLARTCHPDVVAMNQKETSANEFMKIHSAYSTLSDPNKRAQYDRQFYGHNNRRPLDYTSLTSSNINSMSGYRPSYAHSGMNWETDQCW
ncbi:chaperone protein dnaJ 11, chloroplastic-like [Neltuma alba]|uniref:chaperone protein dnaJ 11, chloroplastic-like n=1 Tax=Neltuma alba TaxID=207710 RepID=UPI0010A51240|nr:chaperone protein dnaJ 11, chloroplastic-like [Prosopis alba]